MRRKQGIGELREYLPRGYAVELAKQFGCSRRKVYMVAAGTLQDYRLLQAILDIAEKNISIEKKIQRTINQTRTQK